MSFFEKLRPKNNINTNEKSIEYRFCNSLSELLLKTDTGFILIKKNLTSSEIETLESCKLNGAIFHEKPASIREDSFYDNPPNGMKLILISRIELDYLYQDETLYVFSENSFPVKKKIFPNVVKVAPFSKSEFENTFLQNIRVIAAPASEVSLREILPDANSKKQPETVGTGNTDQSEIPDQKKEIERTKDKIKEIDEKIDLYAKEIDDEFRSNNFIVKTELKGTRIENKTIPLTKFYKKYNIAKGRLKGSWSLFDSGKKDENIDTGLVTRAIEKCNKEFTYRIEGYDFILPEANKEKYEERIQLIIEEYIEYIEGKKQVGDTVGGVEIKTECKLVDALGNSEKALIKDYIPKVFSANLTDDNERSKLKDAQYEIRREFPNIGEIIKDIEAKTILKSYVPENWKDVFFVQKVLEVRNKKDKKTIISEEFYEKLESILSLLEKKENNEFKLKDLKKKISQEKNLEIDKKISSDEGKQPHSDF